MQALIASLGCFAPAAFFVFFWAISCIKVINEYERSVIFRLGKVLDKPKGPGLIFIWRPVDKQ